MADAPKPRDLTAGPRAAFLALATKSALLDNIVLTRDTDERKQPTWSAQGEHYKNADIAPLIDAGILSLSHNHRDECELRFTPEGVEAWFAYSGLERPAPRRTIKDLVPETGREIETPDWRVDIESWGKVGL